MNGLTIETKSNLITKIIANAPKHRVYVDVLGNDTELLFRKALAKVTVINDYQQKRLSYLLNNPKEVERYKRIMLECVSFQRLFKIYDCKEALMLVDFTNSEFTYEEEKSLIEELNKLAAAVFVISNNELLYAEWFTQQTGLYTNFEINQLSLF